VIVLTGPPFEWEVATDTAVTIGVFDGVHVGHRRVIADLILLAASEDLSPAIVTFDPHPLSILAPERAPLMLTSVDQRIDQFRRLGAEIAGVLDFPDIRQLSADEFCEAVLSRALRAKHVVVGADFRFGRDRGGDANLLMRAGDRLGFEVSVVDLFGSRDGVVSSTRIRQLIGDGQVEEAAVLLGRPYELAGDVVEGEKRGHKLGFPTANLGIPPDRQLPGRGVYAGTATVGSEVFAAAVNVGTRPTFDGRGTTIEAHLLDYAGDLYGRFLTMAFMVKLREEMRFDGPDALIRQIHRDVERVREVLN
jgi:riboflavin kinase / FMN adenylyltransferase